MKATHTLYLLFITLLCVAGFTACDDSGSDDMIWDFAPIELHIAVQDAQGNDLLNPETPGNIAKQGIKAIYNGKYMKGRSNKPNQSLPCTLQRSANNEI